MLFRALKLMAGTCMILSMLNGAVAFSQTPAQGDIVVLTETIRNAMPGMNSNAFVIPTTAEKNFFGDMLTRIMNGEYDSVESKALQYGYEFIQWYNVPTGDTLYILKETIPVQRGWGTYVFNPAGILDCTIEVPHPIWDTKSWKLGILDFLALKAVWFIMAGTHRYANNDSSSDVAHETQTIFHKAHQIISSSKAIQIHGFGKSDPVYNGYPDVVISAGTLYPQNVLFTIKSAYETQGMTAGVYSLSTQSSLSRLAATTNKQGQWSNSNSKMFIHIEHDTPIRTDSVKTVKAVAALIQAIGNVTSTGYTKYETPASLTLYQNYPNPFNPSTTLSYVLPEKKHVLIKIYDSAGKEITTIVNELQQAGAKAYTWNATEYRLASGIYFASLVTDEYTLVRKILFIQ